MKDFDDFDDFDYELIDQLAESYEKDTKRYAEIDALTKKADQLNQEYEKLENEVLALYDDCDNDNRDKINKLNQQLDKIDHQLDEIYEKVSKIIDNFGR